MCVSGLINVDKYITAWENNKKIGKDLFFGLAGFLGGAGHFFEAGDKMLGALESVVKNDACRKTIEMGIHYGVAHGGLSEMAKEASHIGHVMQHDIMKHHDHPSHAEPGEWQDTQTQLTNLNQVFSHDSEFNARQDELALHIAFHYAEQIDALSPQSAATFGQVCADHWLEALKMNYIVFPRDKTSSQFSAKGLAWMAYVDVHKDYTKKITYRGKLVPANDILKKPGIKTNYRIPQEKQIDHDQLHQAPVYFDWQWLIPKHACKALENRIATATPDAQTFGYRQAFKSEVATAQTNKAGELIQWPHAFTLNGTPHFSESSVIEKRLYKHLEYLPCPYAQTWVLEQRVKHLEKELSEQKVIQDKLVNHQTQAYKAQQETIEGMEQQLQSQQKELATLKETVDKQNKIIKQQNKTIKTQAAEIKGLHSKVDNNKEEIRKIKLAMRQHDGNNQLNDNPSSKIENIDRIVEEESKSQLLQLTDMTDHLPDYLESPLQQNSLFELDHLQQKNDKRNSQSSHKKQSSAEQLIESRIENR